MTSRLAVLFLVLTGAAHAAAPPPQGYRFTVNGRAFTPAILSLHGTPGQPQPGDLLDLGDHLIPLGPSGAYDFHTGPGGSFLLRQGGKDRLVAVTVDWTYEGETKVVRNPLKKLSPAELRGLLAVRVDDWNEDTAQALKKLDPARVCLTLTDNAHHGPGRTLPPLPAGLVYLQIDERSNRGISDYSRLSEQTKLRFLRVRGMTGPVDAASLAKAADLRYLGLRGCGVRNVETLSRLRSLRHLDLGYTDGTDRVSFATPAAMPHLRNLNISRTAVEDLRPLGGHRQLRVLEASESKVRFLPKAPVPALRRLTIMSTRAGDEAVAAFAAAHPGCRVLFRWEGALRDELKGATRLRVRSGGTCHRNIAREKTLFEVKDARLVAQLVANIKLDEKQSRHHCMCCGDPSFEFYRGDDLVATLGFHHGIGMRWPGAWPADAALTDDSADYLCRLMDKHGIREPLAELTRGKKQRAAMKRRGGRYTELAPDKVREALKKAESAEQAIAAFEKGVPDKAARARLYLGLLGCDHGSWDRSAGLDDFLTATLLPRVKSDDLLSALDKASPEALSGAGRWLFRESKWKGLPFAKAKGHLLAVARHTLTDPRQINRRSTLAALSAFPDRAGAPLLRSVLAGEIKPRKLAAEDEDEPGGMMIAMPGDLDLSKGSDIAQAALQLARCGDGDSLAKIREVSKSATGADRKLFDEAIALLGKKR
jgi:hypothetical protein